MCVCVHELTCISLYEHMGCVCVLLVSVLCAYVNVKCACMLVCSVHIYIYIIYIFMKTNECMFSKKSTLFELSCIFVDGTTLDFVIRTHFCLIFV